MSRGLTSHEEGSSSVAQKLSTAAPLLGISNINDLDESVKKDIVNLINVHNNIKTGETVEGLKENVTPSNIISSLALLHVVEHKDGYGSAYRNDGNRSFRISSQFYYGMKMPYSIT